MSTRAIVTVSDNTESWSIYCHGDGYPECVGLAVKSLVDDAPNIDPNVAGYGKPYKDMARIPNVSSEACKFAAILLGRMWADGYGGAYLESERSVQSELEEPQESDIDWLYDVDMTSTAPLLTVYKSHWHDNQSSFVQVAPLEFVKAT